MGTRRCRQGTISCNLSLYSALATILGDMGWCKGLKARELTLSVVTMQVGQAATLKDYWGGGGWGGYNQGWGNSWDQSYQQPQNNINNKCALCCA